MAEYIKREDAFDVACAECEAGTFYDIPSKIEAIPSADVVPRKDYESMERTVDKLNKALAERKRGKWDEAWLDHQYCGCRPRAIYCSNCHIVSAFKTPFCPNCGAWMESEGEE